MAVSKCLRPLVWATQLYCHAWTLPVYILSGNTSPAKLLVLSVSVVELPFCKLGAFSFCALVRVTAPLKL